LPFIQTGFNSSGRNSGVLIASSDNSSIDGMYFSGSVLGDIARFKRDYDADVTPISVNSVLDINFADPTDGKYLKFKPQA
jgi:hypothetical protein